MGRCIYTSVLNNFSKVGLSVCVCARACEWERGRQETEMQREQKVRDRNKDKDRVMTKNRPYESAHFSWPWNSFIMEKTQL